MGISVFLILFPLCCAPVMYFITNDRLRAYVTYVAAGIIAAASAALTALWVMNGAVPVLLYKETETANHVILAAELLLMVLVTRLCFKYKKYWISLLSIVPTLMIARQELSGSSPLTLCHIYIDHFSVLMCLIVGVVGSLIVVYAVGYMYGYHMHRKDVRDNRRYFYMLLFIFLGAMFGFVLSESLLWIDFFWEVTSVCSFLLIGYTKEKEAIDNSFRALWMNLLGGTALAAGILYFEQSLNCDSLHKLIEYAQLSLEPATIAVALIAFAALTKAAQLPFSTWLMGAMVAPTPSSALLHSATMVKAGIYVLFRLAPAMGGTATGNVVVFIGGFTFFMASIMAISQSDGKKVLAFSTISNLGLMTACAGVGTQETVWAGVFLMMFHAVSKSLLFQDVGATENATGSRDIEDMHGLLYRLPMLGFYMFIGIAAMFLAPFGMLISKWSALKAAVDRDNIFLVLFITYGSATTGFYWTKWMGKIISRSHETGERMKKDITRANEKFSMSVHAVMMIALCVLMPWLSDHFINPLLAEMFGRFTSVLPNTILTMMVLIMCVVFVIPVPAYLYSKKQKTNYKLNYMSGINTGKNNAFVDSFGEEKRLWLSNYYFDKLIRPDKMMFYCQLLTAAVLAVMVSFILGGVLV